MDPYTEELEKQVIRLDAQVMVLQVRLDELEKNQLKTLDLIKRTSQNVYDLAKRVLSQ